MEEYAEEYQVAHLKLNTIDHFNITIVNDYYRGFVD